MRRLSALTLTNETKFGYTVLVLRRLIRMVPSRIALRYLHTPTNAPFVHNVNNEMLVFFLSTQIRIGAVNRNPTMEADTQMNVACSLFRINNGKKTGISIYTMFL